jgi:hypothetical protein
MLVKARRFLYENRVCSIVVHHQTNRGNASAIQVILKMIVIAGLDPAIHPLSQEDGCAGQARA